MSSWEYFYEKEKKLEEKSFSLPKISIVIPTFNCSQSIAFTIKSILNQEYPEIEVVIIDANSTDRTLEIIKSFHDQRIQIFTVAAFHPFEMLNRGISVATGEYINFLYPGDFYLQVNTLKKVMQHSLNGEKPYLIYGASLKRMGVKNPTVYLRSFSGVHLKTGEGPTSLQACWFHKELFKIMGRFSLMMKTRIDYEFFCRLYDAKVQKNDLFSVVALDFVAVDSKTQENFHKDIIGYFIDTMKVMVRYFGFLTVVKSGLLQMEIKNFILLKIENVKKSFQRKLN